MAPTPAGCPSLHELEGLCEYCGEICDSTQDELNAIACTYDGCATPTIYHQHCIETYLKSIRLDKQRKTGFQCPRGCGKGSKTEKPCPGRVTKSHPIHARNDSRSNGDSLHSDRRPVDLSIRNGHSEKVACGSSSKNRRKLKMPEPAPTAAGSPASVKKEKVEKEKEKVPPLFKSKSAKLENDVDSADNKLHTTSLKSLVLNRASTFPTCTESVGRSTRGPNYSVKGSCSSNDTTNGGSKLLTREATLAAIAAARSEIAASKGGGGLKNGLEIYGQSNQNHAVEIGSAQISDTDDENLHRMELSKDFKQVASVRKGGGPVPLVNAWATGRPRNGELQKDSIPPSPRLLLPNVQVRQQENPFPPLVQPSSPAGLSGADYHLEADHLKARTKNEKKHLQRAAKAREKREAEEVADAVVPGMSVPADLLEKHSQFKLPHRSVPIQGVEKQFGVGKRAGLRPWNERCKLALSEKKFSWLVNQLQEYGFADWQSILAVHICGSDLEQCLDWLLHNSSTMQRDMRVQRQGSMDILIELNKLEEFVLNEGFSQDQVEVAVVSSSGDIEAAFKHLRSLSSNISSPISERKMANVSNGVFQENSVGQVSSQGSGSLTTGMWESILNGSSNGRPFSPFSGSAISYDSESSLSQVGFISDVAHYNALVGIDDPQVSLQDAPISGPYATGDRGSPKVLGGTSMSQGSYDQYDSLSSKFHKGVYSEPTVSTVTSVAAAVLNDTFGFDDQVIAQLTEAIAANEPPFIAPSNSATPLNGIWSNQPSAFSSSAGSLSSNGSHASSPSFYTGTNFVAGGQSYFQSSIGTFAKAPLAGLPEPPRSTFKNSYPGTLRTQHWGDQPVKVVDEAEEQEILMAKLLAQLLV